MISSIPVINICTKIGTALLSWIKSFYIKRKKATLVEAESLLKLKEDIKQNLFYIINNINLEIAHFELIYIFQMDNAFLEAELLKDRDKIDAFCRAALLELEKIIVVKEDCLKVDFIKAASALIAKVRYRNWEQHMQANHDTYGALEALVDEIKFLLKHEIIMQCKR